MLFCFAWLFESLEQDIILYTSEFASDMKCGGKVSCLLITWAKSEGQQFTECNEMRLKRWCLCNQSTFALNRIAWRLFARYLKDIYHRDQIQWFLLIYFRLRWFVTILQILWSTCHVLHVNVKVYKLTFTLWTVLVTLGLPNRPIQAVDEFNL